MKTHSAHANICNRASLEIHASLEIRAFGNISGKLYYVASCTLCDTFKVKNLLSCSKVGSVLSKTD